MRRAIGLLVTSGLLPMLALGGAFGVLTLRAQRGAIRENAYAVARFTATLAAVRLEDGRRAINMIGQSPAFDGALDRARFGLLAQRLLHSQTMWRTLSVADVAGRRLLDVPDAIGGVAGGPVVNEGSFRRTVAGGVPVVGDVVAGPRHGFAFAVRAPVIRDGRVAYVVSAVVPAANLGGILRFRSLPDGWRAAIVDGAGHLVASSALDSTGIGRTVSLPGLSSRRTGHPDFYEFVRHDGTRAVGTWAPIAGTDWSVHVSVPETAYSTPAANSLALIVGVGLSCLLLLAILIRLLMAELRQYRARQIGEVQSQRMEALGRLTGGVAHDFNNLLTPIVGGLDLLRLRVADDPKSLRYVEAAMTSAERARALVARLLAFSRRQTLAPRDIDLGNLLRDLGDLLDGSVQPTARIRLIVPEQLPPVRADPNQLELAVVNLAINARDAMPQGGVVTVSAAAIRVQMDKDLAPGRYVAISVADTGVGMDEATLRLAIDPFFTTKPPERGTGLGLSMVHGFAAQSAGILRLKSEPGVGTTATIILPEGEEGERIEAPAGTDRGRMEGRLLIVDDDDEARSSTAELLREGGYRVAEAQSVRDALQHIAGGEDFDAVVTDYLMPGQTGADLIRELRRERPAMPVLLVTGYVSMIEDIPSGVTILQKPFRLPELLDKVRRILA